jgi:3-oxoacyl-[acyl-carrier-protein] synthase-1
MIQSGLCDAVVAGGVDTLCKLTVRGFAALEATSKGIANPFSRHRDGINLGEGAALFLLSRDPSSIELLGVGETSDAYHISAPDPEGRGAEAAVRAALDDADCAPGNIGYVNLHGTGTQLNDAMESAMMARVFGRESVPASSTKPLTGHLLGAAAATELAFCWLALSGYNAARELPVHHWDGERDALLDPLALVAPGTRLAERGRRCLMSNSFAFGGSNLSLVIGDAR